MKRVVLTLVLAVSLCLTTAGAAHADPVSMIAAVLVTALGEGAAIAVATFIVNTAIYAATSLGVTAVTSALSGKNKAGIAERQASVTRLSLGELPRELLIGEVCTAGTLVDGFNFGGKYGTDTVTRCVAVADHAIESVVGYYVDDQFYPWTVDGIQPGFSNKLSIRFYNATVDGHAPQAHVLAAGAGWTNADRLAGIAVFWIDTQYDEKVWSQGHPEIKFVLRGIRAYDMRFDPAFGYAGPSPQTWEDRASHTYTRNAAILRYAFTRGIFAEGHHGDPNYLLIGRGLTAEEAPPERIIAAANLCDEMVNGQPRYTANGVIRAADDFITVEEMFAAAMAGQIVQREGGVEVEPGQAKAAVVTITDGDLVPGETVSFSAFLPDTDGGRINTVIPRYVSPAQNWKDHAGAVRRDPAHIIADGGPREVTLPLILVTSSDQADRCAEITRLLARLERRASIVLPPEYATLEEGDWIAWRSDRHHGGATVRYRIESWSLDEKWRQHLSLREIASSVFGVPDPIEDTAKVPPPPVPLDALSLDGVTAEAITLPGEASTMPAVRLRWNSPVDAAVRAIRAEVRRVGETDAAPTRTEELSAGVMVVTNGVAAGAFLEVRLVPIGDPSRPVLVSPWLTVNTVELMAGDVSSTSPTIAALNDQITAAFGDIFDLDGLLSDARADIDAQGVEIAAARGGQPNLNSRIVQVNQARIDGDTANAEAITLVQARTANTEADIIDLENAQAAETIARAQAIERVEASGRVQANLQPNPTFASGLAGYNYDPAWQVGSNRLGTYAFIDQTGLPDASRVLDGATTFALVAPGERLVLSGEAWLDTVASAGAGLRLQIGWYNASDGAFIGGTPEALFSVAGGYDARQRLFTTGPAPSPTSGSLIEARIRVYASGLVSGGIRNLKAENGSVPTLYTDDATVKNVAASVTATTLAIVDLENQQAIAAYEVAAVASGGLPAMLRLISSTGGGYAALIAPIVALMNSTTGSPVEVLRAIGGEAFFSRPIYIDLGTKRLIVGPGNGWVMWFGAQDKTAATATRTNGSFSLGDDGQVYLGAAALAPASPFTASAPTARVKTQVGGSGTITTTTVPITVSGATGTVTYTWSPVFGEIDGMICSNTSSSSPTFSAAPSGVGRVQTIWAWTATDSGTGTTRAGQTYVTIQRDA